MKRKVVRWVSIALAVVALGSLLAYHRFADDSPQENAPVEASPQKRPPLSVRSVVISPKPIIEYIPVQGTLIASEEVDLSFESSGRITVLNINEGQKVQKGTLLAKINDNELQAQRDKINVQLKLAEDREQRQRTLLEREAISRESYEQSLAEMQALKADLAQIEAKIEKSSIVAPFDGIVGLRYTSEGAFVSPGTLVTTLTCISPLKVDFSISERHTGNVHTGMAVFFKVEGYLKPFEAKIYAIEPRVDVKTRTIVLRAIYPNTREALKPGRSVSVELQLHLFSDAISIPTEALIPEIDGTLVYVYRNGKAQPLPVKTGIRTETEIQITSGLAVGDTLITSGILQLRTGLPVQLTEIR
ncbi:MAG: efflux RND transporter periplasmic adaptor subunit [Prevotellaceae bacterium]|jgi:membrane fusion protein (multidrug efflux system)|nr:efflux RND transporter periplasmic adaptor subunit [Prevotellaceae bacterium]